LYAIIYLINESKFLSINLYISFRLKKVHFLLLSKVYYLLLPIQILSPP